MHESTGIKYSHKVLLAFKLEACKLREVSGEAFSSRSVHQLCAFDTAATPSRISLTTFRAGIDFDLFSGA